MKFCCSIIQEANICGLTSVGKMARELNVYLYIKNDKIYIEEDWTEEGIASALLSAGVPKQDIVLAFHDPETRKLTEFALI